VHDIWHEEGELNKSFLYGVFILLGLQSTAQVSPEPLYTIIDTITTEYYNSVWYVSGNDTLVKATHSTIEISGYAGNRHKKKQYDKLQKRVIKTYPYAKAAADVMDMYEELCKEITDPDQQKKLLDQAEDEMKKQFEKDLRDMTVNEGIVLIKLIDRETGENSYALVQDLKGRFSAFMWQSVARVFGHNLKDEYEADGEDVWIENIVLQIEDGIIPVQLKTVDPFGIKAYSMKE
jgi:Domain of unknown function (DUF4294)